MWKITSKTAAEAYQLALLFGGHGSLSADLQAVTGAFLAFYYSPSPNHAYDAVNYISKEVAFGGLCVGCTIGVPAQW